MKKSLRLAERRILSRSRYGRSSHGGTQLASAANISGSKGDLGGWLWDLNDTASYISFSFQFGFLNLTDPLPDKIADRAFSQGGGFLYPQMSAVGTDGREFYARATMQF